jgi:hypothetical protein
MGFDIVSITSLESTGPSQNLLPSVATKRPTKEQRRSLIRPPLSTSCIVQFAPSPQRPLHIRSIAGVANRPSTISLRGSHFPLLSYPLRQALQPALLPLNGARRRKRRLALNETPHHSPPLLRGAPGMASTPIITSPFHSRPTQRPPQDNNGRRGPR